MTDEHLTKPQREFMDWLARAAGNRHGRARIGDYSGAAGSTGKIVNALVAKGLIVRHRACSTPSRFDDVSLSPVFKERSAALPAAIEGGSDA